MCQITSKISILTKSWSLHLCQISQSQPLLLFTGQWWRWFGGFSRFPFNFLNKKFMDCKQPNNHNRWKPASSPQHFPSVVRSASTRSQTVVYPVMSEAPNWSLLRCSAWRQAHAGKKNLGQRGHTIATASKLRVGCEKKTLFKCFLATKNISKWLKLQRRGHSSAGGRLFTRKTKILDQCVHRPAGLEPRQVT